MKIDNRFIIYKTIAAFEEDLRAEKIKDDSIVFVVEDHSIRTHGHTFNGKDDHQRGFFESVDKLPNGFEGDCAIVKEGDTWYIYSFDKYRGWQKGTEYKTPDLTVEILNKYIKKSDIYAYLKDVYNNVYVRRDEVGFPLQDPVPSETSADPWRWTEDNLLYKIDDKLDGESTNAIANWVVYKALSDITTNVNSAIKTEVLSQSEYNALEEYKPNTMYWIYEE